MAKIDKHYSCCDHFFSGQNSFVVAEITFKVVVITSLVVKITFVVAEIPFKVAVVTSSVAKITFVVVEIIFR